MLTQHFSCLKIPKLPSPQTPSRRLFCRLKQWKSPPSGIACLTKRSVHPNNADVSLGNWCQANKKASNRLAEVHLATTLPLPVCLLIISSMRIAATTGRMTSIHSLTRQSLLDNPIVCQRKPGRLKLSSNDKGWLKSGSNPRDALRWEKKTSDRKKLLTGRPLS